MSVVLRFRRGQIHMGNVRLILGLLALAATIGVACIQSESTPTPTGTPMPSLTISITRPPTEGTMPQWVVGILSAIAGAILVYGFAELRRRNERIEEQRQAAAALRYELESNLGWLDDIFESLNYLRDEAWVAVKNNGYISHLQSPIPMKVITTYDQLHRLNEEIRVLKETEKGRETFDVEKGELHRERLRESIVELRALFDRAYPRIGKNFR